MVKIDISDRGELLFSIEVKSYARFNRNKELINDILGEYVFEMRTDRLLEEIKQKVQFIIDTDAGNYRKFKLEKINQSINR